MFFQGILQTDDRTALQEIARQLELENVLGDQVQVSRLNAWFEVSSKLRGSCFLCDKEMRGTV